MCYAFAIDTLGVPYVVSSIQISSNPVTNILNIEPPPPSYMMYERLCLIKIWYRLKEKYGLQFEESYLRLGGAHILECRY